MVTYEVARGERLSLVPLLPDSKRPFEKDWQHTPPIIANEDPETAWKHVTSTGEAGIVARMSGLLAFESDTPERELELRQFLVAGSLESEEEPLAESIEQPNAVRLLESDDPAVVKAARAVGDATREMLRALTAKDARAREARAAGV
jgi:hypothetical protein